MKIEERFDDQVRILRERINAAFESFEKEVKKDDNGVIGIGLIHTGDCPSFESIQVRIGEDCSCSPRRVEFTINKDGRLEEKGV